MAIDPQKKGEIYRLVKTAYGRLDRALYKIQDGDDYVSKQELNDALDELKSAYRML